MYYSSCFYFLNFPLISPHPPPRISLFIMNHNCFFRSFGLFPYFPRIYSLRQNIWAVYIAGPVAGTILTVVVLKFIYHVDKTDDTGLDTGLTDVGFLGGEQHVERVMMTQRSVDEGTEQVEGLRKRSQVQSTSKERQPDGELGGGSPIV